MSVIVWLGPESNGSGRAFTLITKYVDKPLRNRKTTVLPHDSLCVLELWGRRYWIRMWIVQEIVMARKVFLHCGDSKAVLV
jgi:hypothetical protein